MKHAPVTIYRAAAIRDAAGTAARPGAVAVRNGRVVAAGRPDELPRRVTEHATFIDRPDELILPAMVNAHAHLDMTAIGPVPYEGDFARWLHRVKQQRPRGDEPIIDAVKQGAAMSLDSGVGHVGDIAHRPAAILARAVTQLPGVSYLETFGVGARQSAGISLLDQQLRDLPYEMPLHGHSRGVLLGISPHAPFTAGPDVYDHATRLSRDRAYRICTHLAETVDEIEFTLHATGMYRELLRAAGVWDDSITGNGKHPVDHLEPYLRRGRWLVAHCNYVEDEHVDILQRTGASVVYCPIASDYFGHTNHRYREMLDHGVNVCLGTDSILCQPPDEPQPLGVIPQMRHLYRRDRTDPQTLLAMATTHGMLALELSESDATLRKRAPACFATVRIDSDGATDPLVQALESDHPLQTLDATEPGEPL